MYRNPNSDALIKVACSITRVHAAGIRKALDRDLEQRLRSFNAPALSPRYQIRIRQVRQQLLATFGDVMSAELSPSKNSSGWVFVSKSEHDCYGLYLLTLKKTRYGVISQTTTLPILATAHFVERLIQQAGGGSFSLAKTMVEAFCQMKRTERAASGGEPSSYGIAVAMEDALLLGGFDSTQRYTLRTYISSSRLIEKRNLWSAMRNTGGFARRIEGAHQSEWTLAA